MALHNFFPTTLYHINDLKFTSKVLKFLNKTINDIPKHEGLGYNTTYDNSNLNSYIEKQGWIQEHTNKIVKEYLDKTQQSLRKKTQPHYFYSNIKNNAQHTLHHHPQSIFSGIYYLEVEKNSSPIVFHNPNIAKDFNSLWPITPNGYNNKIYPFFPKSGDILLWESWLFHSVPPNNSTNRKTLVFNVSDTAF